MYNKHYKPAKIFTVDRNSKDETILIGISLTISMHNSMVLFLCFTMWCYYRPWCFEKTTCLYSLRQLHTPLVWSWKWSSGCRTLSVHLLYKRSHLKRVLWHKVMTNNVSSSLSAILQWLYAWATVAMLSLFYILSGWGLKLVVHSMLPDMKLGFTNLFWVIFISLVATMLNIMEVLFSCNRSWLNKLTFANHYCVQPV